jgi:hypothetical protein
VRAAHICGQLRLEFFSDGIGQGRSGFVIDAQNLLADSVRPSSEKTPFRWRPPALYAKDAGNVDTLASEMSNQRVASGVIADSCYGQDARAERSEIVGGVGTAAWNNLSFAMFEDQDGGFAGDTGDFAELKFIGNEIAEENNSFRGELLDAFAKGEKVDGSRS